MGLITNSQVLIVAAMVVGPEYNAIIAVALGISHRDRGAVRDGLLALLWGFLAAIALRITGLGLEVVDTAPSLSAFSFSPNLAIFPAHLAAQLSGQLAVAPIANSVSAIAAFPFPARAGWSCCFAQDSIT